MKPLKLTMSAFGPYKDKMEVDFTVLGDNGIFLITGDTGAGKTTIFDGISFALFGESSGTHRDSSTLRSKFATNETSTYVCLRFSHRGKNYTITRNPSYLVPKKRGDGETQKPSDAYLEYDNNILTGTKTVNDKIIEILGINANQFKQISMLAQGEFLKILFANSDERKTIFRKIFNTELFDQITNKLYEKYKNNKEEVESLKTEFVTNTNNIISKDNIIFIDKSTLTKETISKTISSLEEELTNNTNENKELEIKLTEQEKEFKKNEDNIKTIEDNNKRIIEYNNLKQEEVNLKNKENDIKLTSEKITKNNKILRTVKPIEINIEKLEKDIKDFTWKINYKKELIKKDEETVKHIDLFELEIKKLKPLLDNYNNIKLELKENNDILKNITEILSYYKDKEMLTDSYNTKYEQYLKIDSEYKEEEDKYFRNQAGILATKLKTNDPCPVCGSINHPNIAKLETSVLTKEQLEAKKQQVDLWLNRVNATKQNMSSINSKIDLINQKINCTNESEVLKLQEEITSKNELLTNQNKDTVNNFNSIYSLITSSTTNIDSFVLVDFIEKFNQDNKKVKEELQSNLKLLSEYNQNILELENNLVKEKDKLIATITELGFKDKEDYLNNVLTESEINDLELYVKKYEIEKTTNKTKLEELSKQLTNIEIIDLTEEYQKLSSLKEEITKLKEEKQNIFSIYSNNLKIKRNLDTTSKKLLEYMEKFSTYEELYKLASGSASGKRRVSFEQYVQATYFDMVLHEANLRFQNMTDGRFKLLRKETATSLSAKFALDLDVYDEYNGSRRDVKSLSGGESFKASLSLALGLSDVIQNYSGGIVIDTLFIDEGFGSLDQESREQAINTLNLISNNNKLIGIISHVSELKDRIDKKIIVTKTKEGSEITLEV